jgi:hypothetical protein
MRDARRSSRVTVAATAALRTTGQDANDQALCSVRDISRHGASVETGQPPNWGELVIVRLALGDEIRELRARVIRVQRRGATHFHEVALDWRECSDDDFMFLDDVLATRGG